jgi:hypothetical protein
VNRLKAIGAKISKLLDKLKDNDTLIEKVSAQIKSENSKNVKLESQIKELSDELDVIKQTSAKGNDDAKFQIQELRETILKLTGEKQQSDLTIGKLTEQIGELQEGTVKITNEVNAIQTLVQDVADGGRKKSRSRRKRKSMKQIKKKSKSKKKSMKKKSKKQIKKKSKKSKKKSKKSRRKL